MKRILCSLLVFGIGLTPVTVPLMVQPTWAQTQIDEAQLLQLLQQAAQQTQQGQPLQAIETLQQALTIAQELGNREMEAFAWLGLGRNQNIIGQRQQALDSYERALVTRLL